jgi:hypothetical protein
MNPSLSYLIRQHAKQLLRSTMKKPTSRPKPFVIDKETVVVVHAADKLEMQELSALVQAANKGKGLLVFLGEPKALQKAEGVTPSHAQAETQTVVSSASSKSRKKAPEQPAKAPATPAVTPDYSYLDHLRERMTVMQSKDHAGAVNSLIADWIRQEGAAPSKSLIFCQTNDEVHYMNRRAQAARLAAEAIDPRHNITIHESTLYVGDRVHFAKRSQTLGIEKGELGEVLRIDSRNRILDVRLDSGREVLIPLRDFDAVELGYAAGLRYQPDTKLLRAYFVWDAETQRRKLPDMHRFAHEPRLYVHGVGAQEPNVMSRASSSPPTRNNQQVMPTLARADELELRP